MTTQRPDLFAQIHKGIRALLYSLGSDVQKTDCTDPAAAARLCARLDHDFAMLGEHAAHEDAVVFPVLAECAPGVALALEAQHGELHRAEDAARDAVAALLASQTESERRASGIAIMRAVHMLIGRQLFHMNEEETTAMPVLHQHFTDEELAGLHASILARISPERQREWNELMFSAMHDTEVTGMLSSISSTAQPQVRTMMFDLAAAAVGMERWRRIQERLKSVAV
jgi:hypothetical protein